MLFPSILVLLLLLLLLLFLLLGRFMGDFKSNLLIYTAIHLAQFPIVALADNLIRRALPIIDRSSIHAQTAPEPVPFLDTTAAVFTSRCSTRSGANMRLVGIRIEVVRVRVTACIHIGIDEEMLPGKRVDEHIDETGESHEGTGDGEVGLAGDDVVGGAHAAGGEGEGQADVDEGVDNHVDDDAVHAGEVVSVLAQHGGLFHSVAQVEEHDAVEDYAAEFGDEDPEVVDPDSFCFVLDAEPALRCVSIHFFFFLGAECWTLVSRNGNSPIQIRKSQRFEDRIILRE